MATKSKKSTKKLSFGEISPLNTLLVLIVVAAISILGTYMLTRGNAQSSHPAGHEMLQLQTIMPGPTDMPQN